MHCHDPAGHRAMPTQTIGREATSHSMAKAREKTLSRGESPYLYGIHDREDAHSLEGKA
jgi:hypothetical protein